MEGTREQTGDSSRRALVWSLLGLLLLAALAYLRPLFADHTFAVRDHLAQTVPSRAYLAERLHQGEWPEWWDALRLGERFAGEPNNGVTYPPTWLVALGDPLWSTDLVTILHVLLAGVGALLLARRLGAHAWGAFFAGASLMLSGYITSMVVNGTIILPVGWLPLTAWAALGLAQAEAESKNRRVLFGQALIFAMVLGASVATGNPAWFDGVVLAAALVATLARRRWRALAVLAAAAPLGAALGSASLVPTLMTLRDSSRGAGFSLTDGAIWSMHPWRLLEWVWPSFFGHGLRPEQNWGELLAHTGGTLEAFWSGSLYVGAPVLFCAGVAVLRGGSRARRLGLLSLFFVLLALGRFTPVYGAYRYLVWPERLLRYPEKHIASALVLWSALAGLGLDLLFSARARLRTILLSALPALLLALGALVLWLVRERLGARLDELSHTLGRGVRVSTALQTSLEGGLTAAGVAGLIPLLLLVARQQRLGRFALPAFCLLTCGHLIGHDWSVHVTLERRLIRARPALLEAANEPGPGEWPRVLRRADDVMPISVPGEARALLLHHTALQNDAGRFGFAQLPAYAVAGTPRFDAFVQASGVAPLERVMDVLDVRYLILPLREAAGMGMPVLSHEPLAGQVLLENPQRRPRAFVAYRWRSGQSDEQTFADLFQRPRAQTDLGQIHLNSPGADQTDAPDDPTPCQLDRRRPEHVILRCRAARDGWAVLADEWMHGWTARVDGVATNVERADGLLRAVRVSAGEHVIEFHYRTPGLTLGVWIALVAWSILAGLLFAVRRGQVPGGDKGRNPSHFFYGSDTRPSRELGPGKQNLSGSTSIRW